MLPINLIWKDYFQNHHEGLGTTYERFILHHYFDKIRKRYAIRCILEVPSFGMTGVSGINSLWWAAQGKEVTVVDHDIERIDLIRHVWRELAFKANFVHDPGNYTSLPFEDNFFDLSWNFAAMWFVTDLEKFLSELLRVSSKVVFICIPNTTNIFYQLRKKKQNYPNVKLENINASLIKKIISGHNWRLSETGYLDTPPWPDIAMKKEDMLRKIGLGFLANRTNAQIPEEALCILDYFSGKNKDMETEIMKYAFFENAPLFFQKIWSHHQYFIFTSP